MEKVKVSYRDLPEGIDNFNRVPPRVTSTLECAERNLRGERYAALTQALAAFMPADDLAAYTYSELLTLSIDVLTNELKRISVAFRAESEG